jgi:cell division septal protein FtsQ
MTARRSQSERLAVLEQKVSHMEAELARMSAKVDEMHAVLMQARGVRWAIIAVAGLVGFLAGLSHWVIARV